MCDIRSTHPKTSHANTTYKTINAFWQQTMAKAEKEFGFPRIYLQLMFNV